MTPEQVVRELRRIRYGRPPSIRAIAREAGICHASVYAIMRSGHCEPYQRDAIERAFIRLGWNASSEIAPPP